MQTSGKRALRSRNSIECTNFNEFHVIEILYVPERGNENYRENFLLVGATGMTCFGRILGQSRKVLDLTSQVALMQIAIDGSEGYCSSLEYAMNKVFLHAAKWTVIEGVGALFVVLGVGGISTGTGFLVWMVTRTFPRYSEPDSAQYAILCLVRKGSE